MQTLLSIPEAAAALGLKAATIRAWVLRRKIGYVRVGTRAVRIPKEEISKLIEAGFVPAREVGTR
jgi:excisionase family DNA binding protein